MRWCRDRGVKIGEQRRGKRFTSTAHSVFFFPLSPLVLCTCHTETLSLFSLGCVWMLFCQYCLYLCPPLPPVSLVSLLSYFLHFFSLSLSLDSLSALFLSGFGALSAKWKPVFVQALVFQTWCFRKTSGVPEHVLTTPTHCTSDSTFKQRTHTHTQSNEDRRTHTQSHFTAALHLLVLFLAFRHSNAFSNTFFYSIYFSSFLCFVYFCIETIPQREKEML